MGKVIQQVKNFDLILAVIVFGFCTGIVFKSFIDNVSWIYFLICGAFFVLFCIFLVLKRWYFVVILFIFSFSFLSGYGRTEMTTPRDNIYKEKLGDTVEIVGVVKSEPKEAYSSTSFVIDTGNFSIIANSQNPNGIQYGDEVIIKGVLEKPENFLTDQGVEFDYVSYLYKDGILYSIKNAQITYLLSGHGNKIVSKLFQIKNWIIRGFNKMFTPKEASLLAGINLGEKSNLDKGFRDDLITTGTIHMIALSGYNVTIIATIMREFFVDVLGLGVRFANIFGIFGVVFFVALTGFQSSAVRAGIMAVVGLLGRIDGRPYNAFRALVFAGFVMLLWDPKYLIYDVSFQLSFLATLGIIFVTPLLVRFFVKVPKKFLYIIPLREALSVTLGAQIGVYPFILYKMGTFSLISLPANLMIIPVVPYAMGFGMVSAFLAYSFNAVSLPFVYVTHLILKYITGLVTLFANVPYASVTIKEFPFILCVIVYIVIIYFVYKGWNKKHPAK